MITISSENPDKLVVAVGHGKITGEDYETVLIPAIDTALKAHKKIRLLYQLDKDFAGFTAGAMWDDAKVGLSHLTEFESIAVVTDMHWIVDAVKFFGIFLRCPVKVFSNDELSKAKDWISTTPNWKTVAEV